MVAYIILIAYVMYIFIYNKEKIKIKLRNILLILIPFILLFVVFSNSLIKMNITDRNIWNGSEPNITSAVRGSNLESGGSWNPDDAKFIEDLLHTTDKESVAEACKERIIERYTTTPPLELGKFFVRKSLLNGHLEIMLVLTGLSLALMKIMLFLIFQEKDFYGISLFIQYFYYL